MAKSNKLITLALVMLGGCLILAGVMAKWVWDTTPRAGISNAWYYYTFATGQYHARQYSRFLSSAEKAAEIAPNNPKVMLMLARAYALNGLKGSALICLARAADVGYFFDLDGDPDFSSLKDLQEAKYLAYRVTKARNPVNNSQIAFRLSEKDLMSEGIAYDPVGRRFYVGSMYKRKIVTVAEDGSVSDFVREGQDDLWGIMGIRVDEKRRTLWVNSAASREMRGGEKLQRIDSAVFEYDLDSRKCVGKYFPANGPGEHLFNDLILTSNGDVFVTDSVSDSVFWISHATQKLELFIKAERFTFPNGIATSEDGRCLYVGHKEGISAIDVNTRSREVLVPANSMTLCEIDGIYYYKGTLVAIQNDNWKGRIVQFYLDGPNSEAGVENNGKLRSTGAGCKAHVTGWKILEFGNPLFARPTTGVIVGDVFFYLANSQLKGLHEEFPAPAGEELRDILILKVRI